MISDGVLTTTASSRSTFPGLRCRGYFATTGAPLACSMFHAPHTSPHTSQSRATDYIPQSRFPPLRFPRQPSGHSEFHSFTTPREQSWTPPLSNSQNCCDEHSGNLIVCPILRSLSLTASR